MLRQGPIPQAVQGLLEYLAGFFFIAAPFLVNYTGAGVATAASIVIGILFLVLAAMSSGPTGLAKQLAPAVHALLDAVLAIVLIAAPFVLGFSGKPTPRNLFLIAGVLWLLVTIGSRYGSKPRAAAATAAEPIAAPAPPAETAAPAVEGVSGDTVAPGARPTSSAPGAAVADPLATGSSSTGSAAGTVGPDYGPLDGSGAARP